MSGLEERLAELLPAAAWLPLAAIIGLLAGLLVGWLTARRRAARELRAESDRLQLAFDAERALLGERLGHAREQLAAVERDSASLRSECGTLLEERARLETRLVEQQRHNEARLAEVEEVRRRMATEFENLANRILEEKSVRFAEQNRTGLDALLKPVRDQLGDFRRKVEEVHVADSKDRASLQRQLELLREQNLQMNEDAKRLTRALKGDKKSQGDWGELVLERVLEQSGLRRGEEYEVQGSFRDRENRLLRPDVVVHLPEGRDIIIDSKVSLVAWQAYTNAETDAERERALGELVAAVRSHIDGLSGKDYTNLGGVRSLDFVLMFMPIEPAFMAAFQHDDKLFSTAFEKRIAVVTPTTLLATIRTVENIWRTERQNESARVIADKAGSVYDKLRGFVEEFEKLGKQLATLHNTYDGAVNKLTQGRGNLVRQAEQFRELGVRVKQKLPRSVTERAGLDDGRTDEAADADDRTEAKPDPE